MLLAILTISASSIAFTACGNDDDENETKTAGNSSENNGNNTEAKVDYTATTSVKTATLTKTSMYGASTDGNVTIYEDFTYKYQLSLLDGRMMLYPYIRTNGYWDVNGETSWGSYHSFFNINIQGRGKISTISEVNEKVDLVWSLKYDDWPVAQPKHGYAACYRTENGTLNLRLYISDYKLDSEGTLQSITVQYQLF